MAKQDNVALFEESSQGAVSAATVIVFVFSVVLVFGGMVVFSYAFGPESFNFEIFAGGLVASIVGFLLPFTLLPAIGK
jgi:hypothetical protein